MAITFPRSCFGNAAITNVAETGIINAAPTPCNARNPMMTASPSPPDGANAHPADARKNSSTPIRNVRGLPSTSASRPPRPMNAAIAKTYAFSTHCWPCALSGSSRAIDGNATATTV